MSNNIITSLDTDIGDRLADIKTSGHNYSKKYELIETITISQEGISVIERTQKPDGTPYNFEKIYYEIHTAAGTDRYTITIRANNKKIGGVTNGIDTVEKYMCGEAVISDGKVFPLVTGSNTTSTVIALLYTLTYDANFADSFSSLTFSQNGSCFPVGTEIKIYAVKK